MITPAAATGKPTTAEKRPSKTVERALNIAFEESITRYIVLITSIIAVLVVIEAVYDGLLPADSKWIRFLSSADKLLVLNFVEWFGVLYGFLLPTILVRVWEQFDEIDNVFDKEADAIEMLLGDLPLLHTENIRFSLDVLKLFREYVQSVFGFLNGDIEKELEVSKGNQILYEVRKYYLTMFRQDSKKQIENNVIMTELLTQLNNIIDCRGDRISLSTQRLFESLNFIAIVTSIVWLVPFYFLYFQNPLTGAALKLGIFGWLLVIAVTFLVIIILTIIDDLDDPFGGYWRVNSQSWKDLLDEIDVVIVDLEKGNLQLEAKPKEEHTSQGLFAIFKAIIARFYA
jgi:hypothetical protein